MTILRPLVLTARSSGTVKGPAPGSRVTGGVRGSEGAGLAAAVRSVMEGLLLPAGGPGPPVEGMDAWKGSRRRRLRLDPSRSLRRSEWDVVLDAPLHRLDLAQHPV